MTSCHIRMVVIWKYNTSLPMHLFIEVVILSEDRMQSSESAETGREWMVFVTSAVVSYGLFLRGS